IKNNPRVCATIIEDGGYIHNECGHWYKTVVFGGNIKIVSDFDEKRKGMQVLLNQLETDTEIKSKKLDAPPALYETMEVLKLEITEIHGKSGR
ncbi:MAG: hypothetical protein LBT50_05185, partial [Prevotellaceae bacterium]|nr:hypothetical protein [Prevotellaceae bacterium]